MNLRLLALMLLCNAAFAQSVEKTNTILLNGYYADFELYTSGAGFSASYQKKMHRFITAEAGVSYSGGSTFPDELNTATHSEQYRNKVYFKSNLVNAGVNLHFTPLKSTTHLLSGYAGAGYSFYDGTMLWKMYTVVAGTAVDELIVTSENKGMATYTFGGQYKYCFENGLLLGADVHYSSPFSSTSIAPDYFTAYGIVLGVVF